MARLRWIYFLYYAGVGTFLSYFPSYLRGLGFRGEQIGLSITAQQIAAAPAVLAWAHLADRLGAPARALRFCAGGAALAACGLLFARSPAQVGIALVALGSCAS